MVEKTPLCSAWSLQDVARDAHASLYPCLRATTILPLLFYYNTSIITLWYSAVIIPIVHHVVLLLHREGSPPIAERRVYRCRGRKQLFSHHSHVTQPLKAHARFDTRIGIGANVLLKRIF